MRTVLQAGQDRGCWMPWPVLSEEWGRRPVWDRLRAQGKDAETQNRKMGENSDSLAGQWLKLSTFNVGGTSIPGRGTKVPYNCMVRSKKKEGGEYGATDGRRQSKSGALFLLYFNMEFFQSILMDGLIQSRGECCCCCWLCISSLCLFLGQYSLPSGNLCLENPQMLHAQLGQTSTVPFSLTFFAVVIILLFRLQR